MKIAIVGYGFVGKAIKKLFADATVYDPAFPEISQKKAEINAADVAFICVPTPMLPDGACDTSIVEEVFAWLKTPLIIIRSTVVPGTTEKLIKKYPDKKIVFQPEFIGETAAHPFTAEGQGEFSIFGGSAENCSQALEVYKKAYNSSVRAMFMPPLEAELVKYYCNTTIAAKVTLANEFYNICQAFGANYDLVREGFLMDPRMSRYWTFVYPKARGFGGKCIPKDINAIAKSAEQAGYNPEFIKTIIANNKRIKKIAGQE